MEGSTGPQSQGTAQLRTCRTTCDRVGRTTALRPTRTRCLQPADQAATTAAAPDWGGSNLTAGDSRGCTQHLARAFSRPHGQKNTRRLSDQACEPEPAPRTAAGPAALVHDSSSPVAPRPLLVKGPPSWCMPPQRVACPKRPAPVSQPSLPVAACPDPGRLEPSPPTKQLHGLPHLHLPPSLGSPFPRI